MLLVSQIEILQKRRRLGTYRTKPSNFADYFLQEIDKNAGKSPNYITGKLLNRGDSSSVECASGLNFVGRRSIAGVHARLGVWWGRHS